MKNLVFIFLALFLFSCGKKEIKIFNISGTKVGLYSASELEKYLGEIYSGFVFTNTDSNPGADVQFLLSKQAENLGCL